MLESQQYTHCLSTTYLPPLIRLLKNEGLTEANIFSDTQFLGVSEEDFPQILNLDDCIKILNNVCPKTDRSPLLLGILVGMNGGTGSMGLLGLIGMCSETLDEALRETQRFSSLISPLIFYEYLDKGELVSILFEQKYDTPEPVNNFVLGIFAGVIHSLSYQLLGDSYFNYITESIVNFKTELTQHPDLLYLTQNKMGFKTNFGTDSNRFDLTKKMATATLPGANKPALKTAITVSSNLMESQLNIDDAESSQPRISRDIVESVKSILRSQTDRILTVNEIAEELGLTPRTLARQLKSHNVTYSQLRSDSKMVLAKNYICSANISIKEVAYQIGYSDVSNFSIAFKKYFGDSPANIRIKEQMN